MIQDLAEIVLTYLQFLGAVLQAPGVLYGSSWSSTGSVVTFTNLAAPVLSGALTFARDARLYFMAVSIVVPLIIIFSGLVALNSKIVVVWYFVMLASLLSLLCGVLAYIIASITNINITFNTALALMGAGGGMLVVCSMGYLLRTFVFRSDNEHDDEDDNVNDAGGVTLSQRIHMETKDFQRSAFIEGMLQSLVFTAAGIVVYVFGTVFLSTINGAATYQSAVTAVMALLFAIAIASFFWTILGTFLRGRRFQWLATKFMERNVIKLLLLATSLLYLPIGSSTITIFNCNPFSCDSGFKMAYQGTLVSYNSTDEAHLLAFNAVNPYCLPCAIPPHQHCPSSIRTTLCSGSTDVRLESDPITSCTTMQQFFWPAGAVIMVIILGVPMLFASLIHSAASALRRDFPAMATLAVGATAVEVEDDGDDDENGKNVDGGGGGGMNVRGAPQSSDEQHPEQQQQQQDTRAPMALGAWSDKVKESTAVTKFLFQSFSFKNRYYRLAHTLQKLLVVITGTYIVKTRDISSGTFSLICALIIHTFAAAGIASQRPYNELFDNAVSVALGSCLVSACCFALMIVYAVPLPEALMITLMTIYLFLPAISLFVGIIQEIRASRRLEKAKADQRLQTVLRVMYLSVNDEGSLMQPEGQQFVASPSSPSALNASLSWTLGTSAAGSPLMSPKSEVVGSGGSQLGLMTSTMSPTISPNKTNNNATSSPPTSLSKFDQMPTPPVEELRQRWRSHIEWLASLNAELKLREQQRQQRNQRGGGGHHDEAEEEEMGGLVHTDAPATRPATVGGMRPSEQGADRPMTSSRLTLSLNGTLTRNPLASSSAAAARQEEASVTSSTRDLIRSRAGSRSSSVSSAAGGGGTPITAGGRRATIQTTQGGLEGMQQGRRPSLTTQQQSMGEDGGNSNNLGGTWGARSGEGRRKSLGNSLSSGGGGGVPTDELSGTFAAGRGGLRRQSEAVSPLAPGALRNGTGFNGTLSGRGRRPSLVPDDDGEGSSQLQQSAISGAPARVLSSRGGLVIGSGGDDPFSRGNNNGRNADGNTVDPLTLTFGGGARAPSLVPPRSRGGGGGGGELPGANNAASSSQPTSGAARADARRRRMSESAKRFSMSGTADGDGDEAMTGDFDETTAASRDRSDALSISSSRSTSSRGGANDAPATATSSSLVPAGQQENGGNNPRGPRSSSSSARRGEAERGDERTGNGNRSQSNGKSSQQEEAARRPLAGEDRPQAKAGGAKPGSTRGSAAPPGQAATPTVVSGEPPNAGTLAPTAASATTTMHNLREWMTLHAVAADKRAAAANDAVALLAAAGGAAAAASSSNSRTDAQDSDVRTGTKNDGAATSGSVVIGASRFTAEDDALMTTLADGAVAFVALQSAESEAAVREMQATVDHRINANARTVLNRALMAAGVCCFVALGLSVLGLIAGAQNTILLSTQSNDNGNQLAGQLSWDDFTAHCCCVPQSNMWDPSNSYVTVEQWFCDSGAVVERVREMWAVPYDATRGMAWNQNRTRQSGLVVRGLCDMTFASGCAVSVALWGDTTVACPANYTAAQIALW